MHYAQLKEKVTETFQKLGFFFVYKHEIKQTEQIAAVGGDSGK